MIPIIPIVIVGGGLVVTYAGASILVMVATATVGLGIAGVLGAVVYKMVSNTKGGCDLFTTKGCK